MPHHRPRFGNLASFLRMVGLAAHAGSRRFRLPFLGVPDSPRGGKPPAPGPASGSNARPVERRARTQRLTGLNGNRQPGRTRPRPHVETRPREPASPSQRRSADGAFPEVVRAHAAVENRHRIPERSGRARGAVQPDLVPVATRFGRWSLFTAASTPGRDLRRAFDVVSFVIEALDLLRTHLRGPKQRDPRHRDGCRHGREHGEDEDACEDRGTPSM